MPHREVACRDIGPDVLGQFQQTQKVGDRRAVLADRVGDIVLRQLEFVGQAPIGLRFIDRVQVLALDVFDESHFEERPLLSGPDFAHHDWHAQQAGFLRRAPPALAGDDVKAIADLANDDRLNHAIGLDRPRQVVKPPIVRLPTRLKRVRCETIDIDLERPDPRFSRIGDQSAETFSESGAFVHVRS